MKTVNGTEYRMYRREFLNQEGCESTASVFATVNKTTSRKKWDYCDLTLKISDCSRMISLSFDVGDEKERQNSLKKVEKLQDVLAEFKRALKLEMAVARTRDKHEEEYKKREKEEKSGKKKTKKKSADQDIIDWINEDED